MKQQISGPAGVALIAVVLIIIGVVAWRIFAPGPPAGVSPDQAKQHYMNNQPSQNQMSERMNAPRRPGMPGGGMGGGMRR